MPITVVFLSYKDTPFKGHPSYKDTPFKGHPSYQAKLFCHLESPFYHSIFIFYLSDFLCLFLFFYAVFYVYFYFFMLLSTA